MVNFEGDIKKAELHGMTDVKKMTEEATKSKLDGAGGLSKSEYEAIKKSYQNNPQSNESIKWMEKNQPALHAAIVSDLDYSGYTGTAVGSLNLTRAGDELKQDAESASNRWINFQASKITVRMVYRKICLLVIRLLEPKLVKSGKNTRLERTQRLLKMDPSWKTSVMLMHKKRGSRKRTIAQKCPASLVLTFQILLPSMLQKIISNS